MISMKELGSFLYVPILSKQKITPKFWSFNFRFCTVFEALKASRNEGHFRSLHILLNCSRKRKANYYAIFPFVGYTEVLQSMVNREGFAVADAILAVEQTRHTVNV